MDFFERVGNFFTGGGWSSNNERSKADAERKKREAEERRRRAELAKQQAAQQAKAKPVAQRQQASFMDALNKAPKGEQPKAAPVSTAPRPGSTNMLGLDPKKNNTVQTPSALKMPSPTNEPEELKGLSQEDKNQIYRLRAEGKTDSANRYLKIARDEVNNRFSLVDAVGEVGKATGQVLTDVAQGTARVPETIFRSAILEPLVGNAGRDRKKAISTASDKNTGMRAFLYGEDPVQSYQEQVRNIQEGVNQITGDEALTNLAVFLIPAMAALDLGTGGRGRTTVQAGEDVIQAVERAAGRKLDDIEKEAVKEQVEKKLTNTTPEPAPTAPRATDTPEPTAPKAADAPTVAEAPKEAQDVAGSYQTIYNQVVNDPSLSPQQKTAYIEEARKRHIELLKQVDQKTDASATAQKAIVKQADELAEAQARQQEETIAQVQAEQAAATNPAPQQVVQEEPIVTNPEVDANNAYTGTEQMLNRADEIRTAQQRTPRDVVESFARQIYDPQLKTQGLDNRTLKLLKERGELDAGQAALRPSQSISFQTSVISNPNQATEAIARANGLADIIAKQARAGTQPEFDMYRIYKDELWRMGNGAENTLPVEPSEMALYVRNMEATHPDWVQDNATLRNIALDNYRQRVEAGVDDPEMFANAQANPFYTPRRQVQVEDANTPAINKVFNRSGKTTRQRQEGTVGAVESPIDLFIDDIRNTVVGKAAQTRATLLRDLGFEVTQSAEDAVMRKNIIKEVTDLADLRDKFAKDLGKTRKTGKQAEAQVKKAEDKVVKSLSDMLNKARGNRDDVLNDIVDRDPRYDIEKDAILKQKFNNLTPKEAKEQIKYDLDQLEKKYPAPEQMKREQLLEYARSLGDDYRGIDGNISRIEAAENLADSAKQEVDALRAMIRQAKEEGGDLWEQMRDYAVNPRTGQAEVTYKVNGTSGKIAIPPGLAREWATLDSSFDASAVNRVLGGIGGIQKTFWTGMFNPVFQTLQTIRNWGQMFTNAQGLSAFRPEAIQQFYKSLFSTKGRNSFRNMLTQEGGQYENATRSIMLRRSIADDIINQSSVQEFFSRNPLRSVSDIGRGLNNVLAHISNAQRDQVVAGAMARFKQLGYSDELAREAAIDAATKVFGDFNRVSRLARVLDDTLLPYAGATQAGIRADLRAFKERPKETAAKYGLMLGAMAGIVGWNLQNGAEEYYKTMKEEGRETDYENSLVLAVGQVSRNPDGTWNGLVKIPLTPDFRPLQRGAVDTMRGITSGEGVDPAYLGAQVFNYMTGDISTSVYDPKRTDEGRNPVGGMYTSSPYLNIGRVLSNQSLWDGGQQVDEDVYNKPRNEQFYDSTTGAARALSDVTGSVVTPIQADQILGMFGNFGRALRTGTDEEEGGGFDPLGDFARAFSPGQSMSDERKASQTYFDELEDETFNIQDLRQRRLFESIHQKRTGGEALAKELGIPVPDGQANTGMLDASTKALILLGNEEILEAEMRMADKAKARGEPVNPLFDRDALTPEQRNAILTYRQGKIYNSAGQNRDKNDQTAFTALGLDESWYNAFKTAENTFYEGLGDNDGESTPRTFSGDTKAVASPELQSKLDYYYTLAKGTGDRSRFLRANPDVLAFWEKQNDFTNAEREALGFKPIAEDDESGSGSGGGGDWSPFGLLGDILNVGNVTSSAPRLKENPYEGIPADLEKQLRSLFASRRGGRAPVQLGAESRGNNG